MLLTVAAGLIGATWALAWLVWWAVRRRPTERIDVGSVSEAWLADNGTTDGKS